MLKLQTTLYLLFLNLVIGSQIALASEPNLTVRTSHETQSYSRSELLKRAESLKIDDSPVYGTFQFRAVPISSLLKKLNILPDSLIQFKCLDGFSAPLTTEQVINTDERAAQAYIAIEEPQKPWPPLPKAKGTTRKTAGPFYLIWKNAKLSGIGTEQWPFQLDSFDIKVSLKDSYPAIFPAQDAKKSIQNGFKVFTKNCFPCHTLNLAGDSKFAPDLNVPLSPVEYLKDGFFKKLVRNPQNLRHWPQSRMPSFSEAMISSEELDDLDSYLKHMTERKVTPEKNL